jgi:urease accessory protein
MSFAVSAVAGGWDAHLVLEYDHGVGGTCLRRRRHHGPLLVQKAFYPEGRDLCHTIVLHPPGGVAGGDTLTLDAHLGKDARVLVTTPGAGKWYKSLARPSRQQLNFVLQAGAVLEWLPQETIIFDQVQAALGTRVTLAPRAVYAGWEVLCLGRQAAGETFTQGELRLGTEIWRDGQRLWSDYGCLTGGDPLLQSPVGLGGASVCATLVIAGRAVTPDVVSAARALSAPDGVRAGLTALPDMLVARCLASHGEAARRYCEMLWTQLRPWYAGRPACEPRIWRT